MDVTLLILAGAVLLFFIILFNFIPVGLWISAVAAGVRVSLPSLVAMRLRRVPPNQIILPLIKAQKAGIDDVTQNMLEAHYLAGGNVDRVVDALIAADKARIALPFDRSYPSDRRPDHDTVEFRIPRSTAARAAADPGCQVCFQRLGEQSGAAGLVLAVALPSSD